MSLRLLFAQIFVISIKSQGIFKSAFKGKQQNASEFSEITFVRVSFSTKVMFQSGKLCLPGPTRPEKGFGV